MCDVLFVIGALLAAMLYVVAEIAYQLKRRNDREAKK